MVGVCAKASFCLVIVCLIAFCQGNLDDPCRQFVGRDSMDLKADCPVGFITWNHPRGNLHLSLNRGPKSEFTFCMLQSYAQFQVIDKTDGRNTPMKIPDPAHPSCIKSSHGKVLLEVKTIISGLYVTHMKYSATDN